MTNKCWRLRAFLQGFKDGAAIRECVLKPEDTKYVDYLEGWKMGQEQFQRAADWYRSILGMPEALDVLVESGLNESAPDPCCMTVPGEEHPGALNCEGCGLAVCERHSVVYRRTRLCEGCVAEFKPAEASCTCSTLVKDLALADSKDGERLHAPSCPRGKP